VPSPLAAIRAIALNTFREAIRDRVLYLLAAFALVLISVAHLLSLLTVGDEEKIIKDIGLSAISVFGVLTAMFVGVSLVFKEIERRTVYTLLAHPVERWQFIAGKFTGLLAVLGLNVGLMSAVLFLVLLARGEGAGSLPAAILLIFVELAVVTAFALLFSSLTNPILAALATFAVYVMGHLVWSLRLLGTRLHSAAGRSLCEIVYWILPDLGRLDLKAEAVHGQPLAAGHLLAALAYGVGYAAVVLWLACLAFARRDFR
jgi:ABC-type transport system involved in multi-copper enzyme maturation permease subunit